VTANSQAVLAEAARKAPRTVVEAAARVLKIGEDPTRAAFLARVLNAVADLGSRMPERALGSAAGAASDYAVLLEALEDPTTIELLRKHIPLSAARIRGLRVRKRVLEAEGGTLSAEDAASHLGIKRQAVDKRRKAGRLIGLGMGRRGYVYPAWQFSREGTLPGLEEVLGELRKRDPWMQVIFMLTPSRRLDGTTPLQAVRKGRVEGVQRAARAFGEHGAA